MTRFKHNKTYPLSDGLEASEFSLTNSLGTAEVTVARDGRLVHALSVYVGGGDLTFLPVGEVVSVRWGVKFEPPLGSAEPDWPTNSRNDLPRSVGFHAIAYVYERFVETRNGMTKRVLVTVDPTQTSFEALINALKKPPRRARVSREIES